MINIVLSLFLLFCASFSRNNICKKLYQSAKIGRHLFTNNKSSNYQTKTVCCQTDILRSCYWQSQTLAVMLIILIPGSFVGTSGNGSVGTSGRFSVTDWNTKKTYISTMYWESILLLKKKKCCFKNPWKQYIFIMSLCSALPGYYWKVMCNK